MPEPIKLNTERVVLDEGVTLEEQLDKIESYKKLSKEETELCEVRQQKVEITNNLESSKSTLKELEQKMDTISQIYNQLHNK
jgi:Tfp pilus assembly protein PilO